MVKSNQLEDGAKTVWMQVEKGVRFVWQQPLVYIAVIGLGVILLFSSLMADTFSDVFRCKFLIQDSLNMPSFVCNGERFRVAGVTVVDIPGLSSVIDAPLEQIRRGILLAVVFFGVMMSGYATLIINNAKKIMRLLTFNKQEWTAVLTTLRLFITILFLFLLFFSLIS